MARFGRAKISSFAEAIAAVEQLGPQGMARFQASLELSWVEEALVATGTASIRRRKFPAEQAVWVVLGMAVFRDRSIEDVVAHLGLTGWTTKAIGTIPRHLLDLRTNLAALVLPERRAHRRFPRHVKIKMSNYDRNRGLRSASKGIGQPAEGS